MTNKNDYFIQCGKTGTTITEHTIIDAHTHIGTNNSFPICDSSIEAFIQTMDKIGIDRSCANGLPALYGQAKLGNDLVIQAMKKHPDRIIGYMSVDIGYPETIIHEMNRCLEAGFSAIKIWSYGSHPGLPYDHPNYRPVFEFAQKHKLPILAHTWGNEIDQLNEFFKTCPDVNFILGHAGSIDRAKYAQAATEHKNVYLETCLSSAPRGLIEYFVKQGLADKICFGSDAVFMNPAHSIGKILFAQISESDKAKILGQNALKAMQ